MEIPMLAVKAKRRLNTIVMRSDESMNKYYHQLFKLWEDANTSIDERIEKFKLTLKPSISHVLLAKKHDSLRNLLAAAKSIEKQKQEISNNYPQDPKPSQKPFKPWTNQAGRSSAATSGRVTASAGKNLTALVTNLIF